MTFLPFDLEIYWPLQGEIPQVTGAASAAENLNNNEAFVVSMNFDLPSKKEVVNDFLLSLSAIS